MFLYKDDFIQSDFEQYQINNRATLESQLV